MDLTETPKTALIRHRLYVVLPLFLALASIGVGGRTDTSIVPLSFTQSGSLAVADDGRFAVDGGTVTADADGSIVIDGVALVAGKSFIDVEAAGFTLAGWNGVFEIDATAATKLTLAALTTPVLVTRNNDAWIVPVGMQLTVTDASSGTESLTEWMKERRPLPLPAHYLRERLHDARALYERTAVPVPAASVYVLSDALIRGDTAAFDTSIADVRTAAVLQHADVRDLFTLAYKHKRDMQILPFLLRQEEAAMLLRFHPLTRDRVWPDAVQSARLQLLAQVTQPLSDRSGETVSSRAVQAWHDGWRSLSEFGAAGPAVLEILLPVLADDIAQLDNAGYPARARAYAAALVNGLQPLPFDTPESVRRQIDRVRQTYDVIFSAVSSSSSSEEESEEPTAGTAPVALSTDQLADRPVIPESVVRSLFIDRGFMLTAQTVLDLQDDGRYAVSGLVVGTTAGDRLVGFLFDPMKNLVSGIEDNGKILPYGMALEKYAEWVKGSN